MKNKLFLLCFIIIAVCSYSYSQMVNIVWEKCYGGSMMEASHGSCEVFDKGIVIAADSESNDFDVHINRGSIDFYIVKIKSNGDTLWTRTFGGSNLDLGGNVAETDDSCIVFTGVTYSSDLDIINNYGNGDIFAIKLDANGNTLWKKTYGGSEIDNAYSIIPTFNGGCALFGYTGSSDFYINQIYGLNDCVLINLDQNGDTLWVKTYGGTLTEIGHNIINTSDNGFAVIGASGSSNYDVGNNYGSYDMWLVKLDSLGNIEWEKNYGGSDGDEGLSIYQTNNGGYIMAGSTYSNDYDVHGNHGDSDYLIIRTNSTGDTLWTNTIGGSGSDRPRAIIQTSDNNFVVGGYTNSVDGDISNWYNSYDFWIVKLDDTGQILWDVCMGGNYSDHCTNIFETSDNYLFASGSTHSTSEEIGYQHGNGDVWGVKFDFIVNTDKEIKHNSSNILIYPNPTTGKIRVQAEGVERIEVLTLQGQKVKSQISKVKSQNTKIDLSQQAKGIYIIKVTSKKGVAVEKIVLE